MTTSTTTTLEEFNIVKWSVLNNGEILTYREIRPEKIKVFIFLHATACSSLMLNTGGLLGALSAIMPDYRIIALDLRGNGGSSYNKPIVTFNDFASDVKAFVINLKITKFVLMGTCLGGLVSQIFAAKYPSFLHGLILDGALGIEGGYDLFSDLTKNKNAPWTLNDLSTSSGFYNAINNALNANDNGQALSNIFGFYQPSQVKSTNFNLLLADMMKTRNLKEVLYGELTTNINKNSNPVGVLGTGEVYLITARVLIIHGRGDKFVPVAEAQKLANALGQLKTTLVILPDTVGHFTWYDDLANTVAPIKTFLEANGPLDSFHQASLLTATGNYLKFGLLFAASLIIFMF